MRKYSDEKKTELSAVICNRCGKELSVENGIVKEGCFQGETVFGYFSKKDGRKYQFDLCEDCFDEWIDTFRIPPEQEEIKEFL